MQPRLIGHFVICFLLFTGAWTYFTHNATAKAYVIYQFQKDELPNKIDSLIRVQLLASLNEKFNFGMITRAYRPVWTYDTNVCSKRYNRIRTNTLVHADSLMFIFI